MCKDFVFFKHRSFFIFKTRGKPENVCYMLLKYSIFQSKEWEKTLSRWFNNALLLNDLLLRKICNLFCQDTHVCKFFCRYSKHCRKMAPSSERIAHDLGEWRTLSSMVPTSSIFTAVSVSMHGFFWAGSSAVLLASVWFSSGRLRFRLLLPCKSNAEGW